MDLMGFSDKQQKILQILMREKNGVSIEPFSKLLGISRSATYQHMVILERDGYVKKHASIQTKGRPGATFVLTEKGIHIFPKHYSLFAEMLINLIKFKLGSEEAVGYLQAVGISLAETKKLSLRGKPLSEKIKSTVEIMQELGYDAEIAKSDSDQNMIDAYNCVFHDLAKKNTEICELDLALLSSLLDSKIEQSCCMAKGDKLCRFNVVLSDQSK